MRLGIVLTAAAIMCYFTNIYLIRRYIERSAPGLFELDASLPKPARAEKYLWERTARTGIVPKWVSFIGLLAVALFLAGTGVLLVAGLTG